MLGALFLLVYINDLPVDFTEEIILFADATVIFTGGTAGKE